MQIKWSSDSAAALVTPLTQSTCGERANWSSPEDPGSVVRSVIALTEAATG